MPSWVFLVALMFAGMLAWPALEAPVVRRLRRLRRRLTRKKTRRTSYSYGLNQAKSPAPSSSEPPPANHPSQAA